MKVYRGLDIGTSKASPEARARVRHHLVDVLDVGETMSVRRFVDLAEAAVLDITARGHRVLVVGGTTLYLKSLIQGLLDAPGADEAYRSVLQEEAREVGTSVLHRRLAEVDPVAAARIHSTDLQRIVRALEVHRATGRPLSELQVQWREAPARHPHRLLALRRPRADLHRRIAARVDAMVREGLVDEVRRLLDGPEGPGITAVQSIGYKEIVAHLRGETPNLDDALAKIRSRTNRLARMQETWLRTFPGMEFLDVSADEPAEVTAERAARHFEVAAS
jgi:tRNA dimethylallyltransferase